MHEHEIIEVNHGQQLKLIMVKQKTIDIIQGQLLKLFSVKKIVCT